MQLAMSRQEGKKLRCEKAKRVVIFFRIAEKTNCQTVPVIVPGNLRVIIWNFVDWHILR